MLSRYGEVFELHSTLAEDGDSEVVRDLLRRRKQLVEQRVQERNRLDKGLTEGARTWPYEGHTRDENGGAPPIVVPALSRNPGAGDVGSRLRGKTTRGRCKLFRTKLR